MAVGGFQAGLALGEAFLSGRDRRKKDKLLSAISQAGSTDLTTIPEFKQLQTLDPAAAQNIQRGRFDAIKQQLGLDDFRLNTLFKDAKVARTFLNDSPEQALSFMQQRATLINQLGGDPSDTLEPIRLLQSGDIEGTKRLLDSAIQAGISSGALPEPTQLRQKKITNIRQLPDGSTVGIVNGQEQVIPATQAVKTIRSEARQANSVSKQLDKQLRREQLALRKQQTSTSATTQRRSELAIEDSKRKAGKLRIENKFIGDSAIADADLILQSIDNVLNSPGLESAVGIGSIFPTFPGSDASSFLAKLDVLTNQVFLSRVEKLRGFGQLTQLEGTKLSGSLGALTPNQRDESFRKELLRIRNELVQSRTRLFEKFRPGEEIPIFGGDPTNIKILEIGG